MLKSEMLRSWKTEMLRRLMLSLPFLGEVELFKFRFEGWGFLADMEADFLAGGGGGGAIRGFRLC